jgi:hypothetical protein
MAVRNDFTAGEVLAAADLNDTFASKGDGLFAVTGAQPSTASSVSINNCFSADYQHYLIIISVTGSAELNIQARLRVSGSDNAGANYDRQVLQASDTTVAAARVQSQTQWDVASATSGRRNGFAMYVFAPFLNASTSFVSPGNQPVLGARVDIRSGSHSQTASYDGISFLTSTGTISGSIRVYGFN